MHSGNPEPESYGILPNYISDSTDLGWNVVDLDPYVLAQSGRVGVPLAAISRDAPIKDVPVTRRNPFRLFSNNAREPAKSLSLGQADVRSTAAVAKSFLFV
jgi:hypothetical protein